VVVEHDEEKVPRVVLDGADVVARLWQVSGERVPQRVAARTLIHPGGLQRTLDRLRQAALGCVEAADLPRPPVRAQHRGREDELPQPFFRCVRVLRLQGVMERRPAVAVSWPTSEEGSTRGAAGPPRRVGTPSASACR